MCRILLAPISLRIGRSTYQSQPTFAIYDQYSKRTASGIYEAVDQNCISLCVDSKPYAALIYSNEKFYYVDENHEVTEMNKMMDSAVYYEE